MKDFEERKGQLRRRAEQKVEEALKAGEQMNVEAMQDAFHELRVYQAELEIQNEELRRVQQELERSRNNITLLYNHSPVGLISVDGDGIITRVNNTFCDMLDRDKSSILNQALAEFVLSEDRPRFLGQLRVFIKGKSTRRLSVRMLKGDRPFYAQLDSRYHERLQLSGNNDTREGHIIVVMDISELVETQQRLTAELEHVKAQEQEIHGLMDSTKSILSLESFESTAHKILKGCIQLSGAPIVAIRYEKQGEIELSCKNTAGDQSCKRILEKHADLLEKLMTRASSEKAAVFENTPAQEDAISMLCAPMVLREEMLGALIMVKRKNAFTEREVRMASAFAGFAAISLMNNRQLTQLEKSHKDIKHMNRSLSSLNRDLEAFAYTVSHDLRAPLRKISSWISLVKERVDEVPKELQQMFSYIQNNVEYLRKFVDDVLSFSKSAHVDIEKTRVNISEICQAVIERQEMLAAKRQTSITIEPGLHAMADNNLITMVVTNLIQNAFKYSSPDRELKITIGKEIGREESERVFFVRDNGIGFHQENSHVVFQPFKRLTKAQDFEGSGIGLSTVERIITRHGGRIWAESSPGKGSTFFFTLPD